MNDGGPAFPSEQSLETNGQWNQTIERGMTLRDYFAAHATDDDIFHHRKNNDYGGTMCTREEARYRFADAMLAQRLKDKNETSKAT